YSPHPRLMPLANAHHPPVGATAAVPPRLAPSRSLSLPDLRVWFSAARTSPYSPLPNLRPTSKYRTTVLRVLPPRSNSPRPRREPPRRAYFQALPVLPGSPFVLPSRTLHPVSPTLASVPASANRIPHRARTRSPGTRPLPRRTPRRQS